MMELQESIQKIKQLLKSDDKSNSILAVQLMEGQGISIEDVVKSIDKNDIEIGMNGMRPYRFIPNMHFALYDCTVTDDVMIDNTQKSYSVLLKMMYNK